MKSSDEIIEMVEKPTRKIGGWRLELMSDDQLVFEMQFSILNSIHFIVSKIFYKSGHFGSKQKITFRI